MVKVTGDGQREAMKQSGELGCGDYLRAGVSRCISRNLYDELAADARSVEPMLPECGFKHIAEIGYIIQVLRQNHSPATT